MERITTRFLRSLTTDKAGGLRVYDASLPGFGVLVKPSGSQRFFVRVGGKRLRQTIYLGKFGEVTMAKARAKAEEIRAQAKLGGDPVGDRRRKRGVPLFGEWMEEYLKRVAHERKHPRLLAQDRFYLGLAAGLWKSRQLDAIGTEDVEEARQQIAASRHPGMANKFSSYVSACMGAAFRAGKIPGNPAARLDPRKLNDYPARDRVLSDAEMTRLVEALDVEDEITRTAFQLLITTGARLSEVLWAKWEDVNWKDGTIKLDSPKAGKRQFLSVPKRLVTRLQRMHSTSASPFIVPARTDNTKARADLKPEWEGLKVRAKLEGIRLHDLRRTLSDDTTRRYSLHLASKVLRNTEKVAEKNYQGPINFAEVRKVIEARSKRLLKGRS